MLERGKDSGVIMVRRNKFPRVRYVLKLTVGHRKQKQA